METLVIYTDGACSGNPGPGGWAWAVAPSGEPHGSGGEMQTTNQRMEIHAVLDALQTVPVGGRRPRWTDADRDRLRLHVRREVFQRPMVGEVGTQRVEELEEEPVANTDLWKPLIELVQAGDVSFTWVKGHSGDRMNDLVDRLAVDAIPARS